MSMLTPTVKVVNQEGQVRTINACDLEQWRAKGFDVEKAVADQSPEPDASAADQQGDQSPAEADQVDPSQEQAAENPPQTATSGRRRGR